MPKPGAQMAAYLTNMHAKGKLKSKIGRKKTSMVMHEFSKGSLHSGSKSGPVVTSPAQAKAIAMSEGRKATAHGTTDKSKW